MIEDSKGMIGWVTGRNSRKSLGCIVLFYVLCCSVFLSSLQMGIFWKYVGVELSLGAHQICAGRRFLCGIFWLVRDKRGGRNKGPGGCMIAKVFVGGLRGSKEKKRWCSNVIINENKIY